MHSPQMKPTTRVQTSSFQGKKPSKKTLTIAPEMDASLHILLAKSPVTSSTHKSPSKWAESNEDLNEMCRRLLEEQQKLKQQLKDQEILIHKLRGESRSQLSRYKEPLKMFQEAVSNLEKDRKVKELLLRRSETPTSISSVSNKFKLPEVKLRSERCVSLNVRNMSPGNEENFTFRPGNSSAKSPSRHIRFPYDVFSKRIKRKRYLSNQIE
ncbi:unnamed protein product [Blepharisma stoltei]|uniref:Uncharacterized protein n=1 Tax=Blepharisma stoltei TaxID=1481888 RepID=A0AAU9K7E4_9CILI|nr:unnamed protein product [Blepharisma stoltei]